MPRRSRGRHGRYTPPRPPRDNAPPWDPAPVVVFLAPGDVCPLCPAEHDGGSIHHLSGASAEAALHNEDEAPPARSAPSAITPGTSRRTPDGRHGSA